MNTPTEFMKSLTDRFVNERKVALSTAKQYIQTLSKLNDSKPFKSLTFTKDYPKLISIIDKYAETTKQGILATLVSALSLFNTGAYKSVYNHWHNVLNESRKIFNENKELNKNKKSSKQEENWLSWNAILEKHNELKNKVNEFINNKTLTVNEYDLLLSYIVLSLYVCLPPRRNQDYLNMIISKKPDTNITNVNYYDSVKHKFIFNKYKTSKTNGAVVIDVPDSLVEIINMFMKHHPSKTKTDVDLLVKHDGTPLTSVNSITRILNKLFNKKIGSSMLRHIYLSSKYNDVVKEMDRDSKLMAHSVDTQKDYIVQ